MLSKYGNYLQELKLFSCYLIDMLTLILFHLQTISTLKV